MHLSRRIGGPVALLPLLAAFWGSTARGASAQTALIVAAHGSDSAWNARVAQTVRQVSWPYGPVEVAYLMGPAVEQSGWGNAVDRAITAGARDAIVVPLLVSSFSGHYRQVLHYAGLRDSMPRALAAMHPSVPPPPIPMRVTRALDAAPELAEAFYARWIALDSAARRAPLLLVAHGPSAEPEAARWQANLARVVALLPGPMRAREIRVAQLRDDAPAEVRAAAVRAMRDTVRAMAGRAADSVTVLPALISTGGITTTKIPRDLEDTPVRYRPYPLAPLPQLARWIERVARNAIERAGVDVSG